MSSRSKAWAPAFALPLRRRAALKRGTAPHFLLSCNTLASASAPRRGPTEVSVHVRVRSRLCPAAGNPDRPVGSPAGLLAGLLCQYGAQVQPTPAASIPLPAGSQGGPPQLPEPRAMPADRTKIRGKDEKRLGGWGRRVCLLTLENSRKPSDEHHLGSGEGAGVDGATCRQI